MRTAFSKAACIFIFLLSASAQQQTQFPSPTYAGFSIRGTVVNALNGHILSQAQVMAAPAGGQNEVAQTVITGADGRFEFHGLAPAKYMLLGQHAGFFRQAYDGHWGFSTAIAVGPNLDSENLVFRLRPSREPASGERGRRESFPADCPRPSPASPFRSKSCRSPCR